MHFILSFFMTSSTAMAQIDVSSIVGQIEDYIHLSPEAGRAAWAMFQPNWTNDPAHVDGALRALAADRRAYEKDDNRARIIRLLVETTSDISGWPGDWREHHGRSLHASLDELLGMYVIKHAQMERVADLFDRLELWTSDQAAWLTDVYLNKLWPRLVVPWLRSLKFAPEHVRAEIVDSVRKSNRPLKTNFIARAVAYRLSPPTTAPGVYKFLTAYPRDAADQGVIGSARQGFRVLSSPEYFDPKAGEHFRAEVHSLLKETFALVRKRLREGGDDNEVVLAIQKAKREKLGAAGRKTPEQHAIFTRLLNYIEDRDPAPLRRFLDVGESPRNCGGGLVGTDVG